MAGFVVEPAGNHYYRGCTMQQIKQATKRLANDESGQSMVEYAIVIALVAIVALASTQKLGTAVNSAFNNIQSSLTSSM